MIVRLLCAFLLSFLITLYITPLLIAVAHKLGIVDKPDGKLKKHDQATAYLGGVAVYFGFLTALALLFPFENQQFLFLVGVTLLLFIGLIDDLIALKPYQKLWGQMIAALCFLKAGFFLREHFFSYIPNIFISFVWIVGIINAFNLIDVMDGLATSVAFMAAGSFLVAAIMYQSWPTAILITAFMGALAAFFLFNKPKARIYLGDSGSLFIGGFMATVPFMLPWGTYNSYGFLTSLIFLMIPLLEVGTLILVRTYKRIPFYQGSPDHFSTYLRVWGGWSVRGILIYSTILSLILLGMGILFFLGFMSLPMFMVSGGLFILFWYLILLLSLYK